MRKILIPFLIIASVATSCGKQEVPSAEGNGAEVTPPEQKPGEDQSDGLVTKTFIVSNLQTKTSFAGSVTDDGAAVMNWCPDDSISIWDGTASRVFRMISEPQGEQTVFQGKVSKDASDFCAFYPCVDESFTLALSDTQYISSEGGLTDCPVYAAGIPGEDDHLHLVVKPVLLKISVSKSKAYRTVTVEGNAENDYLCGNLTLGCTPEGSITTVFADDPSKGKKVTLCSEDGGDLPSGVDMYMVLPAHSFASGYTVTFKDAEGEEVLKGTDEQVVWESGKVYEIQNDYAPPQSEDYYADYNAGEDIIIAGKAFNKADYGNPTLIAKGETATISSNGVYFIEPGADVTYDPSASLAKMIIVGRDPSERSEMTQEIHFKMATNGELAVMNLDIDAEALTGSTYLFNIYGENTPLRFALDNCSLVFGNKHFLYQAKATWVSEVAFHNCDIEFTCTNNDIWLFNVNSAAPAISLMDFRNNVFWHSGTMDSGKAFRITNGSSASLTKLIFKNNTFVNLNTRANQASYLSFGVSQAEITDNIFYFESQPLNGSLLQQACLDVEASDNYYYTGNDFTFEGCTATGGSIKFTPTQENPFTTCNVETGVFVKTSKYASYGADR